MTLSSGLALITSVGMVLLVLGLYTNEMRLIYSDGIEAFGVLLLQMACTSLGMCDVETFRTRDKIFVDKSGRGDVTTVQEAIDVVEGGNENRVTIYIAAGTYM